MAVLVPRILSVAGPLLTYFSLTLLLHGLLGERKKLEWTGIVLAEVALFVSFIVLPNDHRLFYDEDIYIHIGSNLSKAPVAQLTLLGGPNDPQVTTYYKEPVGFPSVLSLFFLLTGTSETVAFAVARTLYALSVFAVFQLARRLNQTPWQATVAAIVFGATPVVFIHSASTGTDMPAALFSLLGMWGLAAGNGALAAAGLALAAQTRLEMIALIPLLFLPGVISRRWKIVAAILVAAEVVHISWLFSVAPVLGQIENVQAAFSEDYITGNLRGNLAYLFNPFVVPAVATVLCVFALAAIVLNFRSRPNTPAYLGFWLALPFAVYLLFYAGSFQRNPRYAIQLIAPVAILAVSLVSRRLVLALFALSVVLSFREPIRLPPFLQALASDHQLAVRFASTIQNTDLVVSTEPEIFFNAGHDAMNAVYASESPDRLDAEVQKRRVLYCAGVRANVVGSAEGQIDQWMKSQFELRLLESHVVDGYQVSYYEVLRKAINGKTHEPHAIKRDRDPSQLG